jgi:hypothetical protein
MVDATTRRKPPASCRYGQEVPTRRDVEELGSWFDGAGEIEGGDADSRRRALGRLLGREVR